MVSDYCDGCREPLDPDGQVIRAIALVPLVREPIEGPSWIYHFDCAPADDGTWAFVYRGRFTSMPERIGRTGTAASRK